MASESAAIWFVKGGLEKRALRPDSPSSSRSSFSLALACTDKNVIQYIKKQQQWLGICPSHRMLLLKIVKSLSHKHRQLT